MTSKMFVLGGLATVFFSLVTGVLGYNEKFAGSEIGWQLGLMILMVFVFESIKVGSICVLTNGRKENQFFTSMMVVLYLATAGSAGWGTYNFLANKAQGDTKAVQTAQADVKAAERRLKAAESAMAAIERQQTACSSLKDEEGTGRVASCLRRLAKPYAEAKKELEAAAESARQAESQIADKTDQGGSKYIFMLVAALVELAALGFFWGAKPRPERTVNRIKTTRRENDLRLEELEERIRAREKELELEKKLAGLNSKYFSSEEYQ